MHLISLNLLGVMLLQQERKHVVADVVVVVAGEGTGCAHKHDLIQMIWLLWQNRQNRQNTSTNREASPSNVLG